MTAQYARTLLVLCKDAATPGNYTISLHDARPIFPAEALKTCQPGGIGPDQFKKNKDRYPARAAARDALEYVRGQWGTAGKNVRDRFDGDDAPTPPSTPPTAPPGTPPSA